jgi:hypothetical protein
MLDFEWYKHFKERWPTMKTTSRMASIFVAGLIIGGIATYFFDRSYIIAGKDAQIDSIKQERDSYKNQRDELKEKQTKAENQTDPYEQPLRTGTATIVVKMEPNTASLELFPNGYLLFVKDQEVLLRMDAPADRIYGAIKNNQCLYKAIFELDQTSQAIDNPISHLLQNASIEIYLNSIPSKSKVADGNAIFIFNDSVPPIKMPISPQTMDGNAIIIKDIQKYFKKESRL